MCCWKQGGNITAENFKWMRLTQDYVQWKASVLDEFNFQALMTIFKHNKFTILPHQLQARIFSNMILLLNVLLFHYFCLFIMNILIKDSELQQWK
jgi:hypothetical protein